MSLVTVAFLVGAANGYSVSVLGRFNSVSRNSRLVIVVSIQVLGMDVIHQAKQSRVAVDGGRSGKATVHAGGRIR